MEDLPTAAAGRPRLTVLGDEYVIQLGGAETAGTYTVLEILCRPGGGTPLHAHSREDECFVVLEGEVEFLLHGESRVARAGDIVHGPRNVPHAFSNRTALPARLLVMAVPAGIEAMFEDLAALPPGPPDPPRLLEITGRYGVSLLPEES